VNTYEIVRELGRGQHGKVKLARDLLTNEYVAIKIVSRIGRARLGRPLSAGSSQEEKVRREIAILKKCNHPNIVKLREVLDDAASSKIYLVLEYVERGEIQWHDSYDNPILNEEQSRSAFRDVVQGLEYLHFQGIIHRDIKPANLLVAHDGSIKISDFGVSYSAFNSELAKTAGTPAFFAPEICYNDPNQPPPPITYKIDIWALGVTLYCFFYGRVPFMAENEFELFNVIATEDVIIPKNEDGSLVADISPEGIDILIKLLQKNSDERPSIPEIKNHPW
ncbi:hypothetical protein CANCADRAFT_13094, partial [Tortispora caseinolytica NRRL Y-17796]